MVFCDSTLGHLLEHPSQGKADMMPYLISTREIINIPLQPQAYTLPVTYIPMYNQSIHKSEETDSLDAQGQYYKIKISIHTINLGR